MFDNVLRNRFNQRIVTDSLDKDGTIVVSGCSRDINLNRQLQVLLQQAMVNILNALKPGQFVVMDVMRFIVEHGQFVNLADDFS